jgi:hypothetical protein
MKRSVPTIFLIFFGLIFALNEPGQTRLFEKYRFEDGGYMLVGIRDQSDKNALAESLGDFYTDDVAVLNAIKKAWVFRRSSPMHACGYHYYLVVLKDGKKIENHSINLNCRELTNGHNSLYFNPQLLARFQGRLQKLRSSDDKFATLAEARKFWGKIHTDRSFVYADEPQWLKYEGSFEFTYKCPDPGCDNFLDRDRYTQLVRLLIAGKYPGEEFDLRQNGGTSNNEIFFEVQSSEALYRKFDLFPISPFARQWRPFSPFLRSYWKLNGVTK